jgi:hypothetical protein
MTKYEDGCYGTLAGIALIAKVMAGKCSMKYTRVAAGKGAIPEGESPKTMSDVAEYVMDAKIAAITNPLDGECQITVQINSADVETGFYCTGLVLFAEDPDLGEIPYTYLLLENEPEWIRPASSIVGKLATFDIIAAVGDVDKVYASIDPAAIATMEEVEQVVKDHSEDPTAHKDIREIAEKALAQAGTLVVIGPLPPVAGPALWLCSDKNWTPDNDDTTVATAELGDPEDADEANAVAEINGVRYPINDTEVEEEDGQVVATIKGVE